MKYYIKPKLAILKFHNKSRDSIINLLNDVVDDNLNDYSKEQLVQILHSATMTMNMTISKNSLYHEYITKLQNGENVEYV